MNGAGNLVFVDTNVLLYAMDATSPRKQTAALRWRDVLWQSKTGRVSWQVLNEFYWNATRKLQIPEAAARNVVRIYTRWQPRGFSLQLIDRAWHWTDHAQLTYWDALILSSAERSRCRWLLSEDFTHKRKYGSVEVINPFLAEPDGFGAGQAQ